MKSIIITGATSGIGFECALELARTAKDKQIIIACRDQQRGASVAGNIMQRTGHRQVICMPLDLSTLASVRQFRDTFARHPHHELHALINNAGMQQVGKASITADGFESTFAVNHLTPFYLTLLLIPFMKSGSSITFTASGTHDPKQTTGMPAPVYNSAALLAHPTDLQEEAFKFGQQRYTVSKLCNVMTTYSLQRRVAGLGIRVNAFDPGFVPGTGLARSYPPFLRFISGYIFKLLILLHRNVHTARVSGRRLAHLALSDQHTGKYFEGEKAIPSSTDSYREDYQEDLWQTSLKLTGLQDMTFEKR